MIQDPGGSDRTNSEFGSRRRARLLMSNWCFSTKNFRHDGAHSARAHEVGDGGQQVDGKNEQVNHRYRR